MSPEYLLDASACIPVLRNRSGLGQLPDPARTGVSAIVAGELSAGVHKNRRTHPHHAARLEPFLGLFKLVEFNSESARHYGEIRATLEEAGRPIGPVDMFIAAQARSLGATLVTANVAEFERVNGLKWLRFK